MPKLLMQEIQQAGVTPAEAKDLVVQCFDLDTLQQFSQYMKQAHYDIPLILLVDCKDGLPGTATMRKLKALSAEAGIGCAFPTLPCVPPIPVPVCTVLRA